MECHNCHTLNRKKIGILFDAVKLMCDCNNDDDDDVRLQFIACKIAFYAVAVTFACDSSFLLFRFTFMNELHMFVIIIILLGKILLEKSV